MLHVENMVPLKLVLLTLKTMFRPAREELIKSYRNGPIKLACVVESSIVSPLCLKALQVVK